MRRSLYAYRVYLIQALALAGLLAVMLMLSASTEAQTGVEKPVYYSPNQVILIGSRADVDSLVRANAFVVADPLRRIDLSYFKLLPDNVVPRFPRDKRATLVAELYAITGMTVESALANLNRDGQTQGRVVYADANYAVGRPPYQVSGDPWSVGAVDAGTIASAPGMFLSQWALQPKPGIHLYNGAVRQVPYTGKQVRVGVFDTSPFTDVVSMGSAGVVSHQSLTMTVYHPVPAYTFPPTTTDAIDHGLFVAGLVHVVAPDSKIILYRVLNQHGQGDLFTLNASISDFISKTLPLSPTINGAVINLSLGVHPPTEPTTPTLPPEIYLLDSLLSAADGFEIVVVAATGNDSEHASVEPMQIPAAFTPTIGVAGSTFPYGRSCFSNAGKIAAPAGDGDGSCMPDVLSCPSDPKFCLISFSRSSPTDYAYWFGTSFAAPLASGAAALVLQQTGGSFTPAQVANRLYVTANTTYMPDMGYIGSGILNLRRALFPFRTFVSFATKL